MKKFGTVDKKGRAQFSSPDINQCRAFLRSQGLEIGRDLEGWTDTKGEWGGLLDFNKGQWHAVAFRWERGTA